MFRLSRDVRFAVDLCTEAPRPVAGHNGFAGKPPITGLGQCFYTLTVTVAGRPAPGTGYLTNIKTIDDAVRQQGIPLVKAAIKAGCQGRHRGGGGLLLELFDVLQHAFGDLELDTLELHLSPFTSIATSTALLGRGGRLAEGPMILLHHTFDFAASHRLHNPELSDEENRQLFGKCNNPHGHGHNYTVRVSVKGEPDEHGLVINLYDLERIVDETVIQLLDHKHLNLEIPEFQDLNPSVENIARVIYDKLRGPLSDAGADLDAVTVWETPKTWCEYREPIGAA